MTALTHCTIVERSLIRFAGEDARSFLHNQLTCDVANLAPEGATYGGYCTPKGRMLATFLLWAAEDGFLLQLPATLRESVQKRISMYILRSKVRAADASGDYAQFGIAGEGAGAVVERLLGAPAAGTTLRVVRTAGGMALRLPRDRYLLLVPRPQEARVAAELAARSNGVSEALWSLLDIEAGVAGVLPATQEQFVPQMLNLDAIDGVSFSKGCYPGQEIVARMHYLGRLKERTHLARLPADAEPRAGDKLFGADLGTQACGTIANAARTPEGDWAILAVIHLSSVAAGPVRWKAVDGPALEMLALPYALPEK